jgi:hypothetical protein
LGSYSQLSNTVVKARLTLKKLKEVQNYWNENLSEVVQSLSYKLSVIRNNNINNNQSNNAQEGLFSLEPHENKNLLTQINWLKRYEVIVLLLFFMMKTNN